MIKCGDSQRKESASWAVMCDRRYQRTGAGSTATDSHHSKWSCESCSADMGHWRLKMCRFITSVCVRTRVSFRFFVCELFMCLSACIHSIWFLEEQCWLPRWSWAARTRVVVLRQRAGNLNLHIPCLQLPDVLPQEPGLLLPVLRFVPRPAGR